MTKDYKYLRSFCSCKDCRYFQVASIPYFLSGNTVYICRRVLNSLCILKLIDPMRDPCKQFILDLPAFDRLCREGVINEDSSSLR